MFRVQLLVRRTCIYIAAFKFAFAHKQQCCSNASESFVCTLHDLRNTASCLLVCRETTSSHIASQFKVETRPCLLHQPKPAHSSLVDCQGGQLNMAYSAFPGLQLTVCISGTACQLGNALSCIPHKACQLDRNSDIACQVEL